MRIFQLQAPEGFEWLVPVTLEDSDVLLDTAGMASGGSWPPPAFELLTIDDEGRPRSYADCPWLGDHVLPIREKARVAVEPLLSGHGEFLALAVEGENFSVFNALRTANALDETRSTIAYGRRSGKVVNIEVYAFLDAVLPRRAAFRLPQQPLSTFFTEDLALDLLALDLAGLRLEIVGDAEPS